MEVQVTVRSLDGAMILGPKPVPREGLVARVSAELLSGRPLRPRQMVSLIHGTTLLRDLDVGGAVVLTATFAPVFGEERRQQCLAELSAVGLRSAEHMTEFIRGLPECACDDPELMTAVLEKARRIGGRPLECALMAHASDGLKDDRRFVRRTVSRNGHLLFHASARLRGSREIVKAAVSSTNSAFVYADDNLRGDPDFVHEMAKLSPCILPFVSPETRVTVKRLLAEDALTTSSTCSSTSAGCYEEQSPAWNLALRLIVRGFKKVSLVTRAPATSRCIATTVGSHEMQHDGLQSLTLDMIARCFKKVSLTAPTKSSPTNIGSQGRQDDGLQSLILRIIARHFKKVSLAAPIKSSATNVGSHGMQDNGLQLLTLRMIARYFMKVSVAAPTKSNATGVSSHAMQDDGLQSLTLRMIARYFKKVSLAAPIKSSATNVGSHGMQDDGLQSLTLRMIARHFKKVSLAAPTKGSATAGAFQQPQFPICASRSPRSCSALSQQFDCSGSRQPRSPIRAHTLSLIVRCVERRCE